MVDQGQVVIGEGVIRLQFERFVEVLDGFIGFAQFLGQQDRVLVAGVDVLGMEFAGAL